nr:hypothetical protein Iba_chr07fCG6210 [Ipomoea batatas]
MRGDGRGGPAPSESPASYRGDSDVAPSSWRVGSRFCSTLAFGKESWGALMLEKELEVFAGVGLVSSIQMPGPPGQAPSAKDSVIVVVEERVGETPMAWELIPIPRGLQADSTADRQTPKHQCLPNSPLLTIRAKTPPPSPSTRVPTASSTQPSPETGISGFAVETLAAPSSPIGSPTRSPAFSSLARRPVISTAPSSPSSTVSPGSPTADRPTCTPP